MTLIWSDIHIVRGDFEVILCNNGGVIQDVLYVHLNGKFDVLFVCLYSFNLVV